MKYHEISFVGVHGDICTVLVKRVPVVFMYIFYTPRGHKSSHVRRIKLFFFGLNKFIKKKLTKNPNRQLMKFGVKWGEY